VATPAARSDCSAGARGHVAKFAAASTEVDAGFVATQAEALALRIEEGGLADLPAAELRLSLGHV
jgi:hypothetical protein